ncbi:hypothetical protein BKG82_27325 [Mycobacteroides chelonae]|uniref:Uncharacterized protein n=1 Tax=Mycobacteroides chelonae TaxID=1774 RepID=A0A1S1LCH8_MYCCH|nr:hypothetical protein [Mycobacteroides chelonae]OHU47363.1 hypothetical protein BKG82_27325 [Mycobacteroides chelonae]
MSSRKTRIGQIDSAAVQLADDRDICMFCEKAEIEHRDERRNPIPCSVASVATNTVEDPAAQQRQERAAETKTSQLGSDETPRPSKALSKKGSHMIKKLAAATLLTLIASVAAIGYSADTAHVVAAVDIGAGQYVCIYSPDSTSAAGSCDRRTAQFRDLNHAPQHVQDAAKAIQHAAHLGAR